MRWWVRGEERATVSTIALLPMANLGDYMIMMTELALVMTELTLADQDPQQGGDSLPLEDDEEDWGKFIEAWYWMDAATQIIIWNIISLRFGATSLAWSCTLGTSFLIKLLTYTTQDRNSIDAYILERQQPTQWKW